jgi:hypothetical protein
MIPESAEPAIMKTELPKLDLKNASVQQPLFMNRCPFLFVIPTRISCHAALDKIACAPFS